MWFWAARASQRPLVRRTFLVRFLACVLLEHVFHRAPATRAISPKKSKFSGSNLIFHFHVSKIESYIHNRGLRSLKSFSYDCILRRWEIITLSPLQMLLCAVYAISKVVGKEIQFKQIVTVYKGLPFASAQVSFWKEFVYSINPQRNLFTQLTL